MKYYTYAYLREDGTPYYIGKGSGNRAYLQLNHMVKTPERERVLILKQNLTEEEANQHEVYMINMLGRKDIGTGILRNLTDGGEGVSGYKHTEETKKKMCRPKSEEAKGKIRNSIKAKWDNGEYDRETYRQRELGKKQSEETIRKKIEGVTNYYKKNKKVVTDEQRNQISETLKNKHKNGEIKSFYPIHTGTRWWNDGQKNKRMVECPGKGWKLGML